MDGKKVLVLIVGIGVRACKGAELIVRNSEPTFLALIYRMPPGRFSNTNEYRVARIGRHAG